MPDRRPIGDRHGGSKTHRRTTCLIGDQSETSTCFIGNPSPMEHVSLDGTPIRHFGLQWVSVQACQSPIGHVGLRWSMSRSPIRHVVLPCVYDNNNIFVNSIWSRNRIFKTTNGVHGFWNLVYNDSTNLNNRIYKILKIFNFSFDYISAVCEEQNTSKSISS